MSCPATGSDTPRLWARCGSSPGTISVPVPTTKLPKASAARLHFMVTVLLESQKGSFGHALALRPRPRAHRRLRGGDQAAARRAVARLQRHALHHGGVEARERGG